jgi:predicted metalloprotease
VQNLLGISDKVQSARRRASDAEGNRLSVRLELQADCLSGVWANHADRARDILEAGDVEEALTAAASIGDDRLQKQSRSLSGLRVRSEGAWGRGRFFARLRRIVGLFNEIGRKI